MHYNKIRNINSVTECFKYWHTNQCARNYLEKIEPDLWKIKDIKIDELPSDNKNEIIIKFDIYNGELKKVSNIQNLRVKLISNNSKFDQIDKKMLIITK